MENTRETLREVEAAAAAPFVNEPYTPSWYHPLMAGFFTAMAAGPLLIGQGHTFAGFGLQAVAIVAVSAFYASHRAKWGTSPRMRSAPAEIKRAYRWMFLALAGCVVGSAAMWVLFGWPFGLATIFVSTWASAWAYDRVLYPRAVQQVRDRLA